MKRRKAARREMRVKKKNFAFPASRVHNAAHGASNQIGPVCPTRAVSSATLRCDRERDTHKQEKARTKTKSTHRVAAMVATRGERRHR